MKRLFKKLTKTGKVLFISITTVLLFLSFCKTDLSKTICYIITNGEEIQNFQPYTVEQAKKDENKILDNEAMNTTEI